MAYKVYIPDDIAQIGKDYLIEHGYEIMMGSLAPEIMCRDIVGCHAVVLRQRGQVDAAVLKAGTDLKVVAKHGVGLDNIDIQCATQMGIQVVYAPESNSLSVAEHMIAFIMSLSTDIVYMDKETRKGNWDVRNLTKAREVSGKMIGLVGVGRIGRIVAAKAIAGLDMRVMAYDPYLAPDEMPEGVAYAANVESVFEQSDFVCLCMPLTPETRTLVDKRLLKMMKPTSYIINCARGGIIHEEDLYAALTQGWISGAGLDCFEQEPGQADTPLFKLDNVIISPHCSAQTAEAIERMSLHACIGIDEVLSGKKPSWPVNQINR